MENVIHYTTTCLVKLNDAKRQVDIVSSHMLNSLIITAVIVISVITVTKILIFILSSLPIP